MPIAKTNINTIVIQNLNVFIVVRCIFLVTRFTITASTLEQGYVATTAENLLFVNFDIINNIKKTIAILLVWK